MSIALAGGKIVITVESTVGTVQTTSVHMVPVWLVIAALAAVLLSIWLIRKKRSTAD